MDDYPSNSHKAKAGDNDAEKKPLVHETSGEIKPKVEKVIKTDVVRQKKPLGRRFMETFVGGDARTVVNYIWLEVLIPAAKDAVSDAISQGMERILFGESRSTRRSSSRAGGFVSYNRYSSSSPAAPWAKNREEPRTPLSKRARASHDFDEIILASRVEADEVIERLGDLVEKYGQATVSDLYDLVGVSGSYTDNRWGWTDVRDFVRASRVTRVRNGYLLDMPRPEPLD